MVDELKYQIAYFKALRQGQKTKAKQIQAEFNSALKMQKQSKTQIEDSAVNFADREKFSKAAQNVLNYIKEKQPRTVSEFCNFLKNTLQDRQVLSSIDNDKLVKTSLYNSMLEEKLGKLEAPVAEAALLKSSLEELVKE